MKTETVDLSVVASVVASAAHGLLVVPVAGSAAVGPYLVGLRYEGDGFDTPLVLQAGTYVALARRVERVTMASLAADVGGLVYLTTAEHPDDLVVAAPTPESGPLVRSLFESQSITGPRDLHDTQSPWTTEPFTPPAWARRALLDIFHDADTDAIWNGWTAELVVEEKTPTGRWAGMRNSTQANGLGTTSAGSISGRCGLFSWGDPVALYGGLASTTTVASQHGAGTTRPVPAAIRATLHNSSGSVSLSLAANVTVTFGVTWLD